MKVLHRNHLNICMFNELCGYWHKQWGLDVLLQREIYYLGYHLGCLEISTSVPAQEALFDDKRCPMDVLLLSLFGDFFRITFTYCRKFLLYQVSTLHFQSPSILAVFCHIPSFNPIHISFRFSHDSPILNPPQPLAQVYLRNLIYFTHKGNLCVTPSHFL